MKHDDWYADFACRTFEDLMERLTEDFKKHLASAMGEIPLESTLGNSDVWEILGRYSGITSSAAAREDAAYRMLGLERSASDAEVKKRYRELARRLHPDVACRETEHLFKLVQAAYERIARERGWKA